VGSGVVLGAALAALYFLADRAPAPIKSNQSPVRLLREAVESRDPEVLFTIGEAQGFLTAFNGEATKNELAWLLVACRRGLDCSANAEWVKVACANDSGCASFTGPATSYALKQGTTGTMWGSVRERSTQSWKRVGGMSWVWVSRVSVTR
jgi:hypothetical protein